jgi:hypothetical protein
MSFINGLTSVNGLVTILLVSLVTVAAYFALVATSLPIVAVLALVAAIASLVGYISYVTDFGTTIANLFGMTDVISEWGEVLKAVLMIAGIALTIFATKWIMSWKEMAAAQAKATKFVNSNPMLSAMGLDEKAVAKNIQKGATTSSQMMKGAFTFGMSGCTDMPSCMAKQISEANKVASKESAKVGKSISKGLDFKEGFLNNVKNSVKDLSTKIGTPIKSLNSAIIGTVKTSISGGINYSASNAEGRLHALQKTITEFEGKVGRVSGKEVRGLSTPDRKLGGSYGDKIKALSKDTSPEAIAEITR